MGSEITGLDDRHAYLKLGNNVARFDFDYLDLPTPTPGFLPRKYTDGGMSFDPDTLEARRPAFPTFEEEGHEELDDEAESTINQAPVEASGSAPIGHARKPGPIPWPENETARAGEKNRPAPIAELTPPSTSNEFEKSEQILVANLSAELDGPAFELRP
jgi:hypothetical protein